MSSASPEEQRYEQILSSDGYPLKNFYTEPPVDLLPTATSYPQFFQTNLLSPNRVIKTSRTDAHSNLRIFYFHLLRLSYEIEMNELGVNKTFITNLRNYVLHPDFEILFTPDTESQRELYNDLQFKKLFCEFLYMLDQQAAPDTEHAVNCFPIIDEVMIHVLRSILANQGHNQEFHARLDSNLAFSELSALLGLGITPYGNCWKFDDSDIFCLEQNGSELYLVYISGDSEGEEEYHLNGDIPVYSNNYLPQPVETVSLEHVSEPYSYQPPAQYNGLPDIPYSSASVYQHTEYYPDTYLPKATESVPLIGGFGYSDNTYGTYTQSLNNFGSSDQFGLSRFAKDSGYGYDHTPPGSDFDRGSANHRSNNLINKPQYDQFEPPHSRQRGQINTKASMISMVSETYQFVDFTNTKTLYKDKVPRNQLKQNSPGPAPQPIVHLNREELLESKAQERDTEDFLAQFDLKKKVSPVYQSSVPIYDFSPNPSYTYGSDFSKPKNSYEYTPQTDIKPVYSSPTIEPSSYSYTTKTEKLSTAIESNTYTPSYNYEPAPYRPLDTILESVQTTKTENFLSSVGSSRLPGDATPIYKLNQKNMYSESGKSIPESGDKMMLQAQMTASITGSNIQGDYYKDFTSSFTLEKLEEPYKANVRAIKNRIRGLKRGALTAPVFSVGLQPLQPKPSFARALYQDDYTDQPYESRAGL